MAITWDGGSGFFDKLGKLVAVADHFTKQRSDFAAPNDSIEHQLVELEGKFATIDRDGAQSVAANRKDWENTADNVVLRMVSNVLTDLLINDIAEQENVETRNQGLLIRELIRFMVRDGKTVQEVSWFFSGVTADSGNTFGGTTAFSINRESIPGDPQEQERSEFAFLVDYEQRGVPQTWRITCTTDADGGVANGAEVWGIQGEGPKPLPSHPLWERRSNQGSTEMISSLGNSLVENGGFEQWAGASPAFWEAFPVTAFREDTTIFYRGIKSIRLTENCVVRQDLEVGVASVVPLKKYVISFMVRRRGTFSSGILSLLLNTAAPPANRIVVDLSTDLPDENTWVRFHAFVNTQQSFRVIPNIKMQLDSVLPSAKDSWVNVDEITVSRVTRFEQFYLAIFAGTEAQRPIVGDGFTAAIAQSSLPAKFQRFMYRFFGRILPSVSAGTPPTIADSLADIT